MEALPTERDCCGECPDPIETNIPGSKGADGSDGSDGADGEDGICCCSETTAGFTMPAELTNVVLTVADNRSFFVGQIVQIEGAGWFLVQAVPGGLTTSMTVTNLEDSGSGTYADNVAPGTVIASGASVCPSGLQGPAGPAGTDGVDGADGSDGADGVDGADGAGVNYYEADSLVTLKTTDNDVDTIAHGAGAIPDMINIRAVAQNPADGLYSAGDEVDIGSFWSRNSTNEEQHKYTYAVDATNVYITSLSVGGTGPVDLVPNKNGADLAYTASKWKWRVRSIVT